MDDIIDNNTIRMCLFVRVWIDGNRYGEFMIFHSIIRTNGGSCHNFIQPQQFLFLLGISRIGDKRSAKRWQTNFRQRWASANMMRFTVIHILTFGLLKMCNLVAITIKMFHKFLCRSLCFVLFVISWCPMDHLPFYLCACLSVVRWPTPNVRYSNKNAK